MLYYERVLPPPPPPPVVHHNHHSHGSGHALNRTPCSSEETVKADGSPGAVQRQVVNGNGEKDGSREVERQNGSPTLIDRKTLSADETLLEEAAKAAIVLRKPSGARIVQSVVPRSRSTSLAPSEGFKLSSSSSITKPRSRPRTPSPSSSSTSSLPRSSVTLSGASGSSGSSSTHFSDSHSSSFNEYYYDTTPGTSTAPSSINVQPRPNGAAAPQQPSR